MFRQNRKKRGSRGFFIPAPFAVMVVLASVSALGYIWLGCCREALGNDLKAMEAEREELTRRLLNEESKWAELKSPTGMEQALARWGIVMNWPRHAQIVQLEQRDVMTDMDTQADVARYARAGAGVGGAAF
jgi:hypothetical protein